VSSLVALLVAILAACTGSGGGTGTSVSVLPSSAASIAASAASVEVELTIFGAASLKGALERAEAAYEAANPGTTLTISTDSSAALETQIEQGAPADLFLSADTIHPQKLVDAGLAAGAPINVATNELAIITPKDDVAHLTIPFDLAKAGIRVIAAGDEVPITTYATQLVDNLAGEPGAPADFAAAYARNVVSKEDNVAAVRAKIELGEGDGAIVYSTDARASDKVATIALPAAANVPARYDGVVVKASPHVEEATRFLEWLAGPAGQGILGELGFLPPSS